MYFLPSDFHFFVVIKNTKLYHVKEGRGGREEGERGGGEGRGRGEGERGGGEGRERGK